jgi:hypothetical protein
MFVGAQTPSRRPSGFDINVITLVKQLVGIGGDRVVFAITLCKILFGYPTTAFGGVLYWCNFLLFILLLVVVVVGSVGVLYD